MLSSELLDFAALQPDEAAARINGHSALRATPYRWPDPASLPRRQWLLGHWLLHGEVTAIIAPGGTGKSTIGKCTTKGKPHGRVQKPIDLGKSGGAFQRTGN